MSPPPEDSAPDSAGPPDRQTMRLLERQLTTDSLVGETAFDPDSYEPRLLQATLDSERYPEQIVTARLDIRWFTTGDFSIHYVEVWDSDERWECRWDRHPNTHNARLHFHKPPTAAEVIDLSLSSVHPLEVYATVFTALEERLETVWAERSE